MGASPRWARLKAAAKALTGIVAVTVVVGLLPVRQVRGDDMLWSIQSGDLVWILPDRVRKADVVLVTDPLDPERSVLRRAVAGPGDRVRIDDSGVRVNGSESDKPKWATSEQSSAQRGHLEQPASPPQPLLHADRRPRGAGRPPRSRSPRRSLVPTGRPRRDSRWWGPISESEISGVVRLHAGPTSTWREAAVQLVLPEE